MFFALSILIATQLAAYSTQSEPDGAGVETTRGAVALQWSAPASCPDASEAQQVVVRLGGSVTSDTEQAVLNADVVITENADGYSAQLVLLAGDSRQTRTIATQECEVLTRALAIVVAVTLDPLAVVRVLDQAQSSPPPGPAVADPEPAEVVPEFVPTPRESKATLEEPAQPEPAKRVRPRQPPELEFGARVGVGVGAFILPRAGAGFTLEPFVGTSRVHLRASAQYWLSREETLAGESSAGANLQLASGGLRACLLLGPRGRWRFPLCGGADLGALIGQGQGDALLRRNRASLLWGAAVVQPGVQWAVNRYLDVWADAAGVVSINRPGFRLTNGGSLHQVGRFGVRAFVGIAVHNPRRPKRAR